MYVPLLIKLITVKKMSRYIYVACIYTVPLKVSGIH